MNNFYDRLIKPIRDKTISGIINSITTDVFSPYDKKLNFSERLLPIRQLFDAVSKYANHYIVGLDNYPHRYVTNGNTHSLEVLFSRTNIAAFNTTDYMYYNAWHTATKKPHMALEEPTLVDDMFFTWPGYKYGNASELDFALNCNPTRLHMDCAYLGLVKPQKIDCSNFETVSISFSKTCAIPYNRIGVLYSKNPIPELEILNQLGYINSSGAMIATKILSSIHPQYWWDKYGHTVVADLCNKNELTPTDCILFAYKDGVRIGLAPYWYSTNIHDQ